MNVAWLLCVTSLPERINGLSCPPPTHVTARPKRLAPTLHTNSSVTTATTKKNTSNCAASASKRVPPASIQL